MATDVVRLLGKTHTTIPHGPRVVAMGEVQWTVPQETQIADGPSGLRYLKIGREVYCITQSGQVTVPRTLHAVLAKAYFSGSA